MLKAIIFDLGGTIIEQEEDSDSPLDKKQLKPLSYAYETLSILKEHFKLALITNTYQSNAESVRTALEKIGFYGFFKIIVTSVDTGIRKPDPKIFSIALRKLHVLPQQAIMVGNDPIEDVNGAKKLGMKTVLLWGSEPIPANVKSDYLIHSLRELPHVVKESETRTAEDAGAVSSSFEKNGKWEEAQEEYLRLAHSSIDVNEYEKAAKYFMKAAVCGERSEKWRSIGNIWLQCAQALEGSSTQPPGTFNDFDEARHFFPTFNPNLWNKLSDMRRKGRAYRNAGYHFEEAHSNQSAYNQYLKSGEAFEKDEDWDEASRSYYMAIISFIKRHGELDNNQLQLLENANDHLLKLDRHKYLKRLQLYYRMIRAELLAKGNEDQADKVLCKELDISREFSRINRQPLSWLGYMWWKTSSRYGTSFLLWSMWVFLLVFVIFPVLYWTFAPILFAAQVEGFDVICLSLSTFTVFGEQNVSLTPLGRIVSYTELLTGFIMLGLLISMIARKVLR